MSRISIFAYYYPFYPSTEELWRITNLNEWDLLKNAPSLFLGHIIKRPIGYEGVLPYYDASDPRVIVNQALLAQKYGIDGFIINTYMDNAGRWYLERPLKNLVAYPGDLNIQFCLNWSFKLPRRSLPQISRDADDNEWRQVEVTPDYFELFIDNCCKNYFHHKRYWKIEDKPVVYLFEMQAIYRAHNRDTRIFNLALERGQKTAQKNGFPGLYYVGIFTYWDEKQAKALGQYAINAATGYAMLPDFNSKPLIQNYYELIHKRLVDWERFAEAYAIPWLPVAVAGWDATSRGQPPIDFLKLVRQDRPPYPWFPLVTHAEVESFAYWLTQAKKFIVSHRITPAVLNITSLMSGLKATQ